MSARRDLRAGRETEHYAIPLGRHAVGALGSHREFRHIHSLLLNDREVSVKIAREQLGHASISTTLNIYTHVVEASHRKAVEAGAAPPIGRGVAEPHRRL